MERVGAGDMITVVSVLTEGQENANELKRQLLPSTTSRQLCDSLLEKVLSCYDKAIELLDNGGVASIVESEGKSRHVHASKKRKTLPRWSEKVRVGLDGQFDDGYNWRKYGQKDILGSNHPRAYYRCRHRKTQGCLATKHVQRRDDDHSVFQVCYRANHSCKKNGEETKSISGPQSSVTSESDLSIFPLLDLDEIIPLADLLDFSIDFDF